MNIDFDKPIVIHYYLNNSLIAKQDVDTTIKAMQIAILGNKFNDDVFLNYIIIKSELIDRDGELLIECEIKRIN